MERCANCKRAIGELEVAWVYRDKPVCGECRERLERRPEPAAQPARESPVPSKKAVFEAWCYSDAKLPWVCSACGRMQKGRKLHNGSLALEICLAVGCILTAGLLLIVAIPYMLWRQFSKSRRCESCGAEALIPSNSPMARQILSGKA